jgi:SH3-like domain-containing protein
MLVPLMLLSDKKVNMMETTPIKKPQNMLCLLFVLWALEPSKRGSYFVYLKAPNSRAIRVRKGPKSQSPIACILTTPKYPLKVIKDYDNWKQVADHEGVIGWVHKSFVVSSEKRFGVTLSTCSLTQKDTNHVVAEIPKGVVIELMHKIDSKNWFVLVKHPTDGKKMTGFVPCSAIWGE